MLKVENVSFSYNNKKIHSSVHVLENVNAYFERGKFYTVFGPSGSGKTTLLSLIGGLDQPVSGRITIGGRDIKEIGYSYLRRNMVSYVFQNYYLFPYMTAVENILMSMKNEKPYKGLCKKAEAILYSLNISSDEMRRKIKYLSGGQQQRVAIARCLASGAEYILADEPTGNLDNNTAITIVELFKDLAENQNKCIIAVTHSDMVKSHSDISYRLCDKKLEI